MQMSMPDAVTTRAEAVVKRSADRRQQPEHHRDDRQPQAGASALSW
jgi:hypothetical protein